MRSFIIILVAATLAMSGCQNAQETAVSISGNISNADTIVVRQVDDLNRKKTKLVEKLKLENGTFDYTFPKPEPRLYELNFPNGKKLQFISDGKSSLEFKGDAGEPENIVITGSPDNDQLAAYEKFRKKSLERLVLSVRKKLTELPESSGPEFERLGKLEVTNYEKHKQELLGFVKKEMGTSLAVYATSTRWPSDPALIEPIVVEFEKAHPGLEMTLRLKEKLAVIKQTSVGGKAPNIKMYDETASIISLVDLQGKYTLIDFWGSWCGPCRREAKTLSALYTKYKPDGFEIFGVGLESDLAQWKQAKALDKRVWPNVLSLTELETETAYDYGISSLPANFLIDAEGTIVARDLHGKELQAKLAELFDQK